MCQTHQLVVAYRIERITVIPQFDEHLLTTERGDQLAKPSFGSSRPIVEQRRGEHTAGTACEYTPLTRAELTQSRDVEPRCPLLARQLPCTDRRGQVPIATGRTSEDHHVAFRTADLCAEHGGQLECTGRLGETHHAVQAVAIGQCKCTQTEGDCRFCELFGMSDSAQERKIRSTVQFRIRFALDCIDVRRCDIRLSFGTECGTITAVVPSRRARCTTVGQPSFELGPREVGKGWIGPHRGECTERMFAC